MLSRCKRDALVKNALRASNGNLLYARRKLRFFFLFLFFFECSVTPQVSAVVSREIEMRHAVNLVNPLPCFRGILLTNKATRRTARCSLTLELPIDFGVLKYSLYASQENR